MIYQKRKEMTTLTVDNASTVKTISNITNPEWGNWSFNYNAQQLNDGNAISTITGRKGSKVIAEHEFQYWQVVETK